MQNAHAEDAQESGTIALLRSCVQTDHFLGKGIRSSVYSMAHIPGFERYVLRVYGTTPEGVSATLAEVLKSTTRLYPPAMLVRGAPLGQILLQTKAMDGINYKPLLSIHLQQPGVSVAAWRKHFLDQQPADQPEDVRKLAAATNLMEMFLASVDEHKINPFVQLIETAKAVRAQGWNMQNDETNILFDPERGVLEMVDQQNTHPSFINGIPFNRIMAPLSMRWARTTCEIWPNPALEKRFKDAYERIDEMVKAAETKLPGQAIRRPVFDTVTPGNTKGIALARAPLALERRLDALYQQTLGHA
jgi:hypothetical protein